MVKFARKVYHYGMVYAIEKLKRDLIKWCSVEIDLDITGSSKNPLFLGILFVLGDLCGGDQTGDRVIFWEF